MFLRIFRAINTFLPVNASLHWLNNVICLFLSMNWRCANTVGTVGCWTEVSHSLRNQQRPLVRPTCVNFCQNFLKPTHETVPLNTNPEQQNDNIPSNLYLRLITTWKSKPCNADANYLPAHAHTVGAATWTGRQRPFWRLARNWATPLEISTPSCKMAALPYQTPPLGQVSYTASCMYD